MFVDAEQHDHAFETNPQEQNEEPVDKKIYERTDAPENKGLGKSVCFNLPRIFSEGVR